MQSLFQQLRERIHKRQARDLLESVRVWYETSREVSEICGEALYDQKYTQGDIGVLLDRADRKLFQYRNHATDAKRAIKRHNKVLAVRVSAITKQVYELRNQTASFLIRSQGPGPFAASAGEGELKDKYYERALSERGFKAREVKTALDKELRAIWPELESVISQVNNNI